MKKLLYIFAIALAFVACKGNEPETPAVKKPIGKVDLTAMITIKGKALPTAKKSPMMKARRGGLTPMEVVQQAVNIKFTSHWAGNAYRDIPLEMSRGIVDFQRDFEMPAIKMYSTDIIDIMPNTLDDGTFVRRPTFMKDFICGFDVVLTDNKNDTIGFVPDSVINKARPLIEQAFNDSNYTECYRLFNEAFIFYPLPDK